MRKCSYCGKEYPDDALECAIDRQSLQPVISEPAQWSVNGCKHPADSDHLKLLSIFHYIVGILTVAFSSIFIIHVAMGISLALHPEVWNSGKGQPGPPAFLGYFMAVFAGAFVLIGWTVGGLTIFSGRCMKHRKRWMFSAIMAGVNCAFFPFGTALGAFTFAVLLRDSVKESYQETKGMPVPQST
jgi:hypothetical protein